MASTLARRARMWSPEAIAERCGSVVVERDPIEGKVYATLTLADFRRMHHWRALLGETVTEFICAACRERVGRLIAADFRRRHGYQEVKTSETF